MPMFMPMFMFMFMFAAPCNAVCDPLVIIGIIGYTGIAMYGIPAGADIGMGTAMGMPVIQGFIGTCMNCACGHAGCSERPRLSTGFERDVVGTGRGLGWW